MRRVGTPKNRMQKPREGQQAHKFSHYNRRCLLDWLAYYSDQYQPGYRSGLLDLRKRGGGSICVVQATPIVSCKNSSRQTSCISSLFEYDSVFLTKPPRR